MGGDHLRCITSEDELSSLDNDYPDYTFHTSSLYRDGDESISESYEFVHRDCDEVSYGHSSNSVEFDGNLRRKNAYNEIMRSYDELWIRKERLFQARSRILRYNPGSWINNADGKRLSNYVIPKTTTLLLIGPAGSGKSSLVNRISRVFDDDKFASERAQVTYNPSTGEGTYFLQEYMIPRGSNSFCLFDTRSLSENFADNDEILQHWMTRGVRHGEIVIRDLDTPSLKMSLKCKAQQSGSASTVIRKVNFVIFVVNAFQVLRSMNSDKKEDKMYMEMMVKTFSSPSLSFKDDKPAIVVTHGDLLSLGDRARVRVYLGEKLGVPPEKQIFDIPDNSDPTCELTIVELIQYSLEHADKNIPCKESKYWVDRSTCFVGGVKDKVSGTSILTLIFTVILLGISFVITPISQVHKHNDPLVTSATKLTANEVHPYIPHDPPATYQCNSVSTFALNHSHKNQGFENVEPEATAPATLVSESVVATSEPVLTSKTLATNSEQVLPLNDALEPTFPSITAATDSEQALSSESVFTSAPTLPSKSAADYRHKRKSRSPSPEQALSSESVFTFEPTLPSKSAADYRHKRKSRSPSPEHRHPKAAVEWHKIRHLWLDSD